MTRAMQIEGSMPFQTFALGVAGRLSGESSLGLSSRVVVNVSYSPGDADSLPCSATLALVPPLALKAISDKGEPSRGSLLAHLSADPRSIVTMDRAEITDANDSLGVWPANKMTMFVSVVGDRGAEDSFRSLIGLDKKGGLNVRMTRVMFRGEAGPVYKEGAVRVEECYGIPLSILKGLQMAAGDASVIDKLKIGSSLFPSERLTSFLAIERPAPAYGGGFAVSLNPPAGGGLEVRLFPTGYEFSSRERLIPKIDDEIKATIRFILSLGSISL